MKNIIIFITVMSLALCTCITSQEEQKVINEGTVLMTFNFQVTRGDYFEIKAYAKNTGTGSAKDVWVDWVLPDSFGIITGSGSVHCQEVAPNTSCWNNITATASLSSNLGADDIRVRVSYVE